MVKLRKRAPNLTVAPDDWKIRVSAETLKEWNNE
jgi:hypothetical protein